MPQKIDWYFAPIPDTMLWDPEVSAELCRLWAAIYRLSDLGRAGTVDQETLAGSLGWSERTLRRWIRDGEKRGMIVSTRPGLGRPNEYAVTRPDHEYEVMPPKSVPEQTGPKRPLGPDGNGRSNRTEMAAPSLLGEREIEKRQTHTAADAAEHVFEAFWNAYPHSRRIDKKNCREKVLRALREKPPAPIMEGLERWLTHWTAARTLSQYIPQTTTWLNQRRWEAEPDAGGGNRRDPDEGMITDRSETFDWMKS